MDLTTTYLGLKLRTPLVPSASPLSEEVSTIRKMEDAGASAIVMHSLFEEQIVAESVELQHHLSENTDSFAEALSFFPEAAEYRVGPEEYLEHIRKAKAALGIPVIASLNGTTGGGWTNYAKKIEQAGADALELNIYYIPTDPDLTSQAVEHNYLEILKGVKSAVRIPVAVKLSPYFSNLANVAKQLDQAGADGLVLFNRFYQPDLDLEALEVRSDLQLSTYRSMRLPLRWISILSGRVRANLAATGGIHRAEDAIKMIMVGASVTMLCSVILSKGIEQIGILEKGIARWMEDHEYESVTQMRGSMSQINCPDPSAFERAQYIRELKSFKVTR
ncbi:MAG: dihydroorotate dehydrogenase-like protein [Candidatus Omnitrophota bacterium]|jgi:dihydroorotate dehydrogenase (fumarate)